MADTLNVSDYEVSATVTDWRVRVEFNGVAVADSTKAVLYREGSMAPVYYFPRDDVRMDLMRRTRHKTHCPFKGDASYWSMMVGEKSAENVVWSYEKPIEEAISIKSYVAFYMDVLGVTYDEDIEYTQHIEVGGHGNVYGNIGIAERLEFTVIGSVANETARIESMTKELDQVILTSEEFANNCPQRLSLVGEFALKGVEVDQKLFKIK